MKPAVHIRSITDPDELLAVEDVQRKVWARDEHAIAGRNLLKACVTSGGLVAGAYVKNRLAGFSYGYWGRRHGQVVFWSHMLAVLPRYRSLGLGAALKHFQRGYVVRGGGRVIEWTFDPLRAPNAHFNFRKLGATSNEYLLHTYGDMDDALNWGLATDRLVAHWSTSSRSKRPKTPKEIPGLLGSTRTTKGWPVPAFAAPRSAPSWLRIAVPADLPGLKEKSLPLARRWRARQRSAFQWAFAHGYTAVDFVTGQPVGWYVLHR